MYNDFYLKFADEAEANAVLFDNEQPKYNAIDIIGTMFRPTGSMLATPEGDVAEMAPLEGWHVNVRHMGKAPELEQYQVFPQHPQRGWA